MSKHDAPQDEPPPYSEVAGNGSVSLSEGAGVPEIRRWDVQTTRPSASSSSSGGSSATSSAHHQYNSGASSAAYAPPAGPPPQHQHYRPPAGPPPRPPHAADAKHRPPPRRDSPEHFHAPHPSAYGPPRPQGAPQGPPHLRYPPGFFCKKCHNTGVKVYKGTTCQDCFDRFGVRTQAQYLPPGAMPVFNGPPRVVQPGDPSIGGFLCGRCRGAGSIRDFFLFDAPCPVCHGVGRVF